MYKTFELVLRVLLKAILFLSTVSAIPTQGNDAATESMSSWVRARQQGLDIYYHDSVFKQLGPGVLNAIGNQTRIILKCEWSSGTISQVKWVYHGTQEKEAFLRYTKNVIMIEDLNSGPPVFRLECVDKTDSKISSQVIIYRGEQRAPYLHKNGEQISVLRLDSTTVQLPCLLNYPLQNIRQLQLFKDGRLMETGNDIINYSPEYGFKLQWTKLEHPFGNYECRVANSTENDFVRLNFKYDEVIRGEIQVEHVTGMKSFYEGDPQKRTFKCKVPISRFNDSFEWYFLLRNGTYVSANATKSNFGTAQESGFLTDLSSMNFHSRNITHVVCAASLKEKVTKFNNTYAVDIAVPVKPKILKEASWSRPIIYSRGMNLTCKSVGDPINFMWLKNGEPVNGLNIETWYISSIKTSTLFLNPSVNDIDSNYTCKVENFLGEDTTTIKIQLRKNNGPSITEICSALRELVCPRRGPRSRIRARRNLEENSDRNINLPVLRNNLLSRILESNSTELRRTCFGKNYNCANIT